jgi:uncharacterized protein (TIGR03086 family)
MSGPAEVWVQAADKFESTLAEVRDEQWEAASPCDEWTVRALVDHAVGAQRQLGPMFGASIGEDADWSTTRSAIETAIADPANLEGDTPPQVFGGMPKHQLLGIAVGDLALHAWDLARAIGADETLPPAAVEAVHMGMQRMPAEMLRSPKMFGPEIPVADDASAQDKLLGFVGRQP